MHSYRANHYCHSTTQIIIWFFAEYKTQEIYSHVKLWQVSLLRSCLSYEMMQIMVVRPSEMRFFMIVKSLENPSKSMKYHQRPRKYNIFCPWTFMDIHQKKCCVLTTWIFMKIHEQWWFSMDYHENPCFLPWNPMNVHVHSWTFIANFDWVWTIVKNKNLSITHL